VLPCDLADPDAAAALGRRALRDHVGVDVVVSNAGLSIRRSLELSYDRFHDYERTIAVNYLGPVALLLTLLPSMRERGSAHVVNVSTIGVQLPGVPRYTAYLASKAAFDAWLRGAAPELRHDGVACTSMYVGLVHTGMSDATAMYRVLPGLSADRAAIDVCWAIVQRPAVTAPPWAAVAGAALGLGRGIAEPLLAAYYGHSDDSAAARGVADEGELEIPALRGLGVRPAVRS
jgi:short-subunit dehydrogenase